MDPEFDTDDSDWQHTFNDGDYPWQQEFAEERQLHGNEDCFADEDW